ATVQMDNLAHTLRISHRALGGAHFKGGPLVGLYREGSPFLWRQFRDTLTHQDRRAHALDVVALLRQPPAILLGALQAALVSQPQGKRPAVPALDHIVRADNRRPIGRARAGTKKA